VEQSQRQQALDWAARTLDRAGFNRLVNAVPETRVRGRLRYWQEQVLAQLRLDTGVSLTTAAEYVAAFEGVPVQELPPPTREEFLVDPLACLNATIDPTWIVEAYRTHSRFRDCVLDWVSESVSKMGDLGSASFWIGALAGRLNEAEVAQLYEAIRDRSRRLECEWREEFVTAFHMTADELPPPQDGWYQSEQTEL
jgi:hypothetical protein